MSNQEQSTELLDFFKALADENRLKIVGLLGQKPASVEAIAQALGLSVSTTSHHLSRLSKSGLVSALLDGHYNIYSLQTDLLRQMSQRLLQEDTLTNLTTLTTEDTFEQKVLRNFVDPDGRIIAFPAQEKKFLVILQYVFKAFEPGRRYSEKEVNELLSRYNEDTASLRRGLIEYKMLARENDGSAYWCTDQE